jgi:hypothetical protein
MYAVPAFRFPVFRSQRRTLRVAAESSTVLAANVIADTMDLHRSIFPPSSRRKREVRYARHDEVPDPRPRSPRAP